MHPIRRPSLSPLIPTEVATTRPNLTPGKINMMVQNRRTPWLKSLAAVLGLGIPLITPFLHAQSIDTKSQTNTSSPAPIVATTPHSTASAGRTGRVSRDWTIRQTPIVDAVQRVRDCVVNIHSERTVQADSSRDSLQARASDGDQGQASITPAQNRVNGMGTGIIIDHRGYIITNQHVVEDVNVIRVHLADGTVVGARVLGRDNESDLALLKIEVNRPLPVMPVGTATDLRVGETVIAVGNAYGYAHTVTQGVVSAIGRDVTLNKEVSYKSLIQTDAAINPGNSGGPLINIWGELVGVNVAIRAGAQGIGFAIPVETMLRVTSQMLRQRGIGKGVAGGTFTAGLVARDVLLDRGGNHNGKSNQEVISTPTGNRKDNDTRNTPESEEDPPLRNVVVDRIEVGSAAEKAGLQKGDILLRANQLRLTSTLDVERSFLDLQPGEQIHLVVRRSGGEKALQLAVDGGRAGALASSELTWRRLGLRLQPIQADEVTRVNPQLRGGMLVSDIRPDSVAAKNGILRGDILVGLHDWEMLNLDNVVFVLNHPNLASFSPLRFFVLRGNQVHRGFLANLDS